MTENPSSRQTTINIIKKYCESRVETLKKNMKKETEDKEFLSYLIGQEIAHKEILGIIHSSNETKTEETE